MKNKQLEKIFKISLILIYFHGLEEIFTGFQYSDSTVQYFANLLGTTTVMFYWIFRLVFWISLPTLYFVFKDTRLSLPLYTLYGVVFFIEIHHLYKALLVQSYYPGMITATIYPIFGLFYWKYIYQQWKHK